MHSQGTMIFGLVKYQPLRIAAYNYDYPFWGHVFGINAIYKIVGLDMKSLCSFNRLVPVTFLHAVHSRLCHLYLDCH